ncbi:hypothetical protein JOM56_001684 [Amanita muscaria]
MSMYINTDRQQYGHIPDKRSSGIQDAKISSSYVVRPKSHWMNESEYLVSLWHDLHHKRLRRFCFAQSSDSQLDGLVAVGTMTGRVDHIRLQASSHARSQNSGLSTSPNRRTSRAQLENMQRTFVLYFKPQLPHCGLG